VKKEKPATVKKVKRNYEKPLLTRRQKLTAMTAGTVPHSPG